MEGVCSHTPYAHCFYAMRSWRVFRRARLLRMGQGGRDEGERTAGMPREPLFEALLLR
jgi:hypothetical protein